MAQGWGWELAGRPHVTPELQSRLQKGTLTAKRLKSTMYTQQGNILQRSYQEVSVTLLTDGKGLRLSVGCYGNCNYSSTTESRIEIKIKL